MFWLFLEFRTLVGGAGRWGKRSFVCPVGCAAREVKPPQLLTGLRQPALPPPPGCVAWVLAWRGCRLGARVPEGHGSSLASPLWLRPPLCPFHPFPHPLLWPGPGPILNPARGSFQETCLLCSTQAKQAPQTQLVYLAD